ncbi:MAG: class I SAM-dependent methyltransferase [Chloroflexota bacterium]|nr:MAG: class I SAM-dependent methyltransferase [Chloroflexota bacterium]
MEAEIRDQLINLNRTFYQTFAKEFSATRQRLQSGVLRILEKISIRDEVLDLGCGNGQLASELRSMGHKGHYVGLDSNSDLLEIARQKLSGEGSVSLLERDLTASSWEDELPTENFDFILAFAVLHHIPSLELRQQLVKKIRKLSAPDGWFIHSEWQLLNSTRLQKRILPWENVGLNPEQVETGDYLIDWRHGGQGLRYVHVFSEQELESLAQESGFQIVETFLSDGEGGKLGLYQIWKGV